MMQRGKGEQENEERVSEVQRARVSDSGRISVHTEKYEGRSRNHTGITLESTNPNRFLVTS